MISASHSLFFDSNKDDFILFSYINISNHGHDVEITRKQFVCSVEILKKIFKKLLLWRVNQTLPFILINASIISSTGGGLHRVLISRLYHTINVEDHSYRREDTATEKKRRGCEIYLKII